MELTLQIEGLLTIFLFSTKKQSKGGGGGGGRFEQSELRESERWPKLLKGETKYTTNHADSEDILIDHEKKIKK